jgi:hypothetical protein
MCVDDRETGSRCGCSLGRINAHHFPQHLRHLHSKMMLHSEQRRIKRSQAMLQVRKRICRRTRYPRRKRIDLRVDFRNIARQLGLPCHAVLGMGSARGSLAGLTLAQHFDWVRRGRVIARKMVTSAVRSLARKATNTINCT